MLHPYEREKLERGFIEAEASLRLSGFTVSKNFLAIKARILAGEITFDEAHQEILAYHRMKSSSTKLADS